MPKNFQPKKRLFPLYYGKKGLLGPVHFGGKKQPDKI
jgi:hypothetical protein